MISIGRAPQRGAAAKNEWGRWLAEEIIRQAQALGYEAIRLDTIPPVMGKAVEMYRRLGFRDIPPYYFNPVAGQPRS